MIEAERGDSYFRGRDIRVRFGLPRAHEVVSKTLADLHTVASLVKPQEITSLFQEIHRPLLATLRELGFDFRRGFGVREAAEELQILLALSFRADSGEHDRVEPANDFIIILELLNHGRN